MLIITDGFSCEYLFLIKNSPENILKKMANSKRNNRRKRKYGLDFNIIIAYFYLLSQTDQHKDEPNNQKKKKTNKVYLKKK